LLKKKVGCRKNIFSTQPFPSLRHYNLEKPVDVITEIIQNCIRGHRDSQSKLYQMYAPGMFVVCQRYAQSREDAEDILQEGFIKVFRHLSQFRFNGSFEGWLRRIMINTALQKYRSQTHLHVINDGGDHSNDHFVDEEISMHIEVKELIALVQQLPTAYRVVFNLYVFEGMKHKEIALKMGITEGTSKSNLYDARQQLQKAVLRSRETAKMKVF
jgi:RNA polymerase sigma-70 factor (ECF subfamily)